MWPSESDSLIADLRSPNCKIWRDIPEGWIPDRSPNYKEECYAIQNFLYYDKENIRSVDDYRRYLVRSRLKAGMQMFAVWFGVIITTYLFGWAIGWVIQGFRKQPATRAG